MTGSVEFFSHIKAKGEKFELGKLEGPLKMAYRQGVVEQSRILYILLKVLNVTEIVNRRPPNMGTTGFKYTVITSEGQFKNGKLMVDKLFVDGGTLDIPGFGELDLEMETVNLELLAAPFKTVDTVIQYEQGVDHLMGDSRVVIPVSVNGTLASPKVNIVSPSIMIRTPAWPACSIKEEGKMFSVTLTKKCGQPGGNNVTPAQSTVINNILMQGRHT